MSYSTSFEPPIKQTVDFEFTIKRCTECGTLWAIEYRRKNCTTCPSCRGEERDELQAKIDRLETRITHMRGALTRAKKKVSKWPS